MSCLLSGSSGFNLDSNRLGIAVHSAGVHLAASMLTLNGQNSDGYIAGGVLMSGVYDLALVAAFYVSDGVNITPDEIAQ